MSYSFKLPFPVLINTIILLLLLITTVIQEAKALNPKFEAFRPQSCGGGPNISYPFWTPLIQKPFSGHPGFKITCFGNKPGLMISGDNHKYHIRNIFYPNKSLLLVNAEAVRDDCHLPRHNLTLNGTPFSVAHTSVNLFFFYNCSRSIPSAYHSFTFNVTCASKVTGTHSFAVFEHHLGLPNMKYSLQTCKSTVSVPIEIYGTKNSRVIVGGKNYSDLLRRGFQLKWSVSSNCSQCEASGGRCGYYRNMFWCFCPSGASGQNCTGVPVSVITLNWRSKLAIGSSCIVGTTLMTILVHYRWKLSLSGLMSFWKKRTRNIQNFEGNTQNVEAFLRNYGTLAPKRYNYSDIKKITSSFKEKLGQGGYGSVFKGKLPDGRLVAVKILNNPKGNGEEFINEVASISKTSHVNIVTFFGFCFDGSKRALIYEFMSNGSLEKFIYDKKLVKICPHLGWDKLHQIAFGIAQGLEYLHSGCNTRILHFDIKPHNILLDEDFCPKISDFGHAKQCPGKDSIISMADARGTVGYIAPEVFSQNFGGVSHKSDVYSYGMMVLEMVGGRSNIDAGFDHTSEIYFPHWMYEHIGQSEYLKLDMITKEEEEEKARKMVLVGLWCINVDPVNRPSMNRVVDMLKGNLESLPIPPKPFLSSPLEITS
ncbi:LEAF RUST 10 DISEASE-RESISTANCE LOCUS RECEPTOR-LIKE PROTEIN KINASE-like 2.1 [Macadamia integrifolia]|uniref:LEAF RUST 10 DISEASE-RESISTANCE LOCUS RECEPTOR-LIKE PROTEIN KINASE-like 2.1 n=1 Tax=Macadamia integrifolia TaxID=60698 RepID=UPI001C4F1B1D|nr:LEAF RUST 10 DISEASE-RESISTANCE LOCUS RECEPTOR-LIKE PROTEIN KINASE-like 2.1 [Macadamia integrifolia]